MKDEKNYNGVLMKIGAETENKIMDWLKINNREILDFREFRLAQRIDVDFGIETMDGSILLAEVKSDKWINENGNFLFEWNRINHYVENKWFYLGWGWRSPAQYLIVRNPESCETFIFNFVHLRKFVALYVNKMGKNLKFSIIETDKQKTTFCILIPMKELSHLYKKFIIK